jgi:hypothetical protein
MDAMENSKNNSLDKMRGSRGRGSRGPSYQHNMNWNHEELMALITCEHKEHIALKQVIDPHANMTPNGTSYQRT